jgi:chemotaxis-related protein WspB
MLALIFQVGADRLALDARRVTEVVPRVRLQPLTGSPPWLAGAFVYRGRVVPVLDLHRLAGAGECPPHLSSRIILVNLPGGDAGRCLGLLAARVDDLRELRPEAAALDPAAEPGRPDLGPVLPDGDGMLRLLDLDRLLPGPVRQGLTALAGEVP